MPISFASWRADVALILVVLITATLVGTAAEPQDSPMPRSFVYVSGYAPTISCYVLDAAHGTLTASSTSPGGASPSFLAWVS